MLPEIMAKQKELQILIREKLPEEYQMDWENLTIKQRVFWIKENMQDMQVEMAELLQILPHFKYWKTYPEDVTLNDPELHEEFIDILFFYLNIADFLGLTAEDINRLYNEKLAVNTGRSTKRDKTIHKGEYQNA